MTLKAFFDILTEFSFSMARFTVKILKLKKSVLILTDIYSVDRENNFKFGIVIPNKHFPTVSKYQGLKYYGL